MNIGEKIKKLRTEMGISQEKLAEYLNVSRSAIAKWETNGGIPEISNLILLTKVFGISLDMLVDDNENPDQVNVHNPVTLSFMDYSGSYYDIELNGWNDGVYDVAIIGEDEQFLYYQKTIKKKIIKGMIGKNHITSITASKKTAVIKNEDTFIDRNSFCQKHVFIELALSKGFIKGFLDFRNDDYLDVVIQSFEETKIKLQFGREINIDQITKIEEVI